MTPTKSLSERLRESVTRGHEPTDDLAIEAADALDAKDEKIAACRGTVLAIVETAGGLVDGYPTGKHNILQRIRTMHDALDQKDAEIALLKEGREHHDELADHLEHELAAQSALLAQAAAALEYYAREPEKAREALAAIRGEVLASRTALADRIREATRKAAMPKKPK